MKKVQKKLRSSVRHSATVPLPVTLLHKKKEVQAQIEAEKEAEVVIVDEPSSLLNETLQWLDSLDTSATEAQFAPNSFLDDESADGLEEDADWYTLRAAFQRLQRKLRKLHQQQDREESLFDNGTQSFSISFSTNSVDYSECRQSLLEFATVRRYFRRWHLRALGPQTSRATVTVNRSRSLFHRNSMRFALLYWRVRTIVRVTAKQKSMLVWFLAFRKKLVRLPFCESSTVKSA